MTQPTRPARTHGRQEYREGPVARAIESESARIPSDTFLWAATGAMAVSLLLQVAGRSKTSNFIAQWAPTLLIFGLYNEIVKTHGHDQAS